tara:strand:+ start:1392 stop:3050 length:1659 start_codon:yes stop_codon:yes gene_type:complete
MVEIDYRNPDYTDIFKQRQLRLDEVRSKPALLAAMRVHYRNNPWEFVNDWGMTYEPRNVEIGRLANIPFLLWPRQVDMMQWFMDRWRMQDDALVEKSRDFGVTWICVGFACTEWLFLPGYACGFGSRKEMLVDKLGDPDCIFEKIRHFIKNVPAVFMPQGFNDREHNKKLNLMNPENGASITGEAGDDIGRGGRKSMYFVDEAAYIEHQQSVDNALSNTTNCKIDISTYNGNGNPFYRKSMKFDNTRRKFVCDWHDDPRKDQVWYDKQCEEKDSVTIAQEIDRDPNASAENVFIPADWVRAARDLHKLIKIPPSGIRVAAFDPADEGDAKAVVCRHGYIILMAETLEQGDVTDAIPWAYEIADQFRADVLVYDADGMGAPIMKLTFDAYASGRQTIAPFYGSGEIQDKEKKYGEVEGEHDRTLKTNGETFENFRAQAATMLRDRFHEAWRIRQQIEEGGIALNVDVNKLISIDSSVTKFFELEAELSRPKREWSENGKIKVESKKKMKGRDVDSPNLFDGCIMCVSVKTPNPRKRARVRTRAIGSRDRGLGL